MIMEFFFKLKVHLLHTYMWIVVYHMNVNDDVITQYNINCGDDVNDSKLYRK